MANHDHLQLEAPRPNLSRAMQWLNVSYSVWHNRKHGRVGPLFQGRFKAVLHDEASVGVGINRYIHLNPVRVRRLGGHEGRREPEGPVDAEWRAARVEALRTYRWSSYPYYAGALRPPAWMTTGVILGRLARERGRAESVYRTALEEAAALGQWETGWKRELKATLLLGPKGFVDRMKARLKGDRREQTGLREASQGPLGWEEITAAVSELWGQDWEALRAVRGTGALGAALYVGRHHSDRTLRELGQLAGGMEYPAVTMAVRRFARRIKDDATLAKKVKRLQAMLLVKT